jgi:hypothetical protein
LDVNANESAGTDRAQGSDAEEAESRQVLATAGDAKKLKLSLLENGYDSLNASLEAAYLAEEDTRAWKLAIFLLVHALELLLKERLRREHSLLVFSNVDKPGHAVSMEVALNRLQVVGVAIDTADQHAIRTAIGWRDRIAHYDVDLSLEDAQRTYALLFEFLHSFHRRELGSDLHSHISEANWWKEAKLIELFRTEFVVYNGVDVIRSWPAEIVAAQGDDEVEIEKQLLKRIPYGQESAWLQFNPSFASSPCHDCAVVQGQLHVPGCDVEQCPRCEGQLITCPCTLTSPIEGGADGEEEGATGSGSGTSADG